MKSPNEIYTRIIGSSNESEIVVEGLRTTGLVDTGSMITTISQEFYEMLDPKPELRSLEDFDLDIRVASGEKLPYSGYVEIDITVPCLTDKVFTIPSLVVGATSYNKKVPIVVGTNVIRQARLHTKDEDEIPDVWNDAFASIHVSSVGVVKTTKPITIEPFDTIVVTGFVRQNRNCGSVVTETSEKGYSSRISVCPRVVKLNEKTVSSRVPVKLFNMSAKTVKIPEKSIICELHEVDVLRTVPANDLNNDLPSTSKIHVHQQTASNTDKSKAKSETFNLDNTNLTKDQKDQAQEFLKKWSHIFSKNVCDLGSCNLAKHRIKLDTDEPFKEPHRRIPPAIFQEVREHLQEMLDAGAIRRSQSPYSSNVVIVRKKDGSIRFCVDYRKLNKKTVKDAYALPRVDDTLHLLAGSQYFSKLDLRSGYWQIEIEEEDTQKTAFTVGTLGFYEFTRMPFGLCNAPATFQRVMERCMGELNLRDCLIYLDDVVIFSKTFEEHLQRLDAVFTKLETHDLKLKASKCEFFQSRITYLGHVVSNNGIETDPEKIKAVKDWPVPKSVKEVRAFLGFTGYYRRFIKGYASIARPLNDLLVGSSTKKKGKNTPTKTRKPPFVWEEKEQTPFDKLVTALTTPPDGKDNHLLAYADFT